MPDKFHHAKTVQQTLSDFSTKLEGLSNRQVQERLQSYGHNALPREKSPSWFAILMTQFVSPLIVVLLVAALISAALQDWVDVSVILAAVLVNAIVGFVQEFKASKSLAALRSLVEPHALVRRGGKPKEITAEKIVPGDILILRAGDRVAADARVIDVSELQVNEAALTGESLPLKKITSEVEIGTPLAERSCMVYAGTSIVAGHGLAVVVATATKTEIGKVAELVRVTKEHDTPLQAELGQLAKWITVIVIFLVTVLFVIGLMTGRSVPEMFEISISLAVAAIPEGLAVSITVILAIGMQRILRRKALVRRLVAAETLGSVSVICTDKTGTITKGIMQATTFIGIDGHEASSDLRREMLKVTSLCSDAYIDSETRKINGSPTEKALLTAAVKAKLKPTRLNKKYLRLADIPFDSVKKFMVTRNHWESGQVLLAKGAPEKIIGFSGGNHKTLLQIATNMTDEGLRVIAVAIRHKVSVKKVINQNELKSFRVIGFIGLHDPLRRQAKQQIKAALDAGVHTVMITGDHPNTARAIACKAGIAVGKGSVVTGEELDKMSDIKFARRVSFINVYARVEPRHKIRIVQAWQERGDVVAMTGDGVNDAPALKAADIGIAVGSGTEVAKQASDLVLMDNNLGTITDAIEQGRVIFDNIRKIVVYLLADSFTEIILIGGSLLFGLPLPFLPAQILWINLVADSFPTVGLTLEPGEPEVMKLKPRGRHEPVLNHEMLALIFIIGIITDVALFGLYVWLLGGNHDIQSIRSIMFAAVGIDSLLYVFAIKSFRRTIFRINPFSNPWLIGGVLIGFGLMFAALTVPYLQHIFEISPLSLSDWGLLLMMGLLKLVGIELTKEWFLVKEHHKSNLK